VPRQGLKLDQPPSLPGIVNSTSGDIREKFRPLNGAAHLVPIFRAECPNRNDTEQYKPF
jgi:hypothetical protein